MAKRKFQDFSVREYMSSVRGKLYGVFVGKTILCATYTSSAEAESVCSSLNADPLFFEKKYWEEYKAARETY